jgi:hypothetical protein
VRSSINTLDLVSLSEDEVQIVDEKEGILGRKMRKPKKKLCHRKSLDEIREVEGTEEDPEEGELSESSSSSCLSQAEDDIESADSCVELNDEGDESNNTNSVIDTTYPPCVRVIVLESASDDIKKGSLFIVTCMGGTIGREGFEHALMLPDSQVDKVTLHCYILMKYEMFPYVNNH